MRSLFLSGCLLLLFSSCMQDLHRTVTREELPGNTAVEVRTMVSCCGCRSLYGNRYAGNRIEAQYVAEISCGLYSLTRHRFRTDAKGRVTGFQSWVAVTDSSFTVPVTESERQLFLRLDSVYRNWPLSGQKRPLDFAAVSGFREGPGTHFPVGVQMARGVNRYASGQP
ncbi:MAG TPA: hypothetical protein VHK69_12270 [Chitinophagaceae bacterium]|jgi:hypothetical protein|nr:hypothetical protein [Chitinophagaceae bacterium]